MFWLNFVKMKFIKNFMEKRGVLILIKI
jgi:hypothetical protein